MSELLVFRTPDILSLGVHGSECMARERNPKTEPYRPLPTFRLIRSSPTLPHVVPSPGALSQRLLSNVATRRYPAMAPADDSDLPTSISRPMCLPLVPQNHASETHGTKGSRHRAYKMVAADPML